MSLLDFDIDEFLSFKNYETLSTLNFSYDANFSTDFVTYKKPTQESSTTILDETILPLSQPYSNEEIIFEKETKQKATQTTTENHRATNLNKIIERICEINTEIKIQQQRMNLQIIDLFRENELLQIELMGNKSITTDDSDKENKTPKQKIT